MHPIKLYGAKVLALIESNQLSPSLTANLVRAGRAFPGLLWLVRLAGLALLLLASSACASREGAAPILTPSPSPAHVSPATAEVSQAITPDSPTLTATPNLPPPLPGWTWYQGSYTGYRIAYPQSWIRQKHWERHTQPGSGGDDPGPIQERVGFWPPEDALVVEVDVWDVASLPGFDLLAWVNAEPDRLFFGSPTEPITYNATILGQPAVFHYKPAEWGTGDMATLLFAIEEHCFRILFNSVALPTAEPSIYLYMLESFSLPDSPADRISIPTGWEKGAGLIIRADPSVLALADLSPDELLPYRQGLTGKVKDWDDDRIYDIRFTLLTDEGHHYAIYREPFRVHFRGLPIDYYRHVHVPRPQNGDRVRVAGQPLASGKVLAQYIAIETNGEWQTWFHKTLFDVTSDEFDPLLLSNYSNGEAFELWLQGPLERTLALLVDELGNPIGAERFSQYLGQNALAHGMLRANGDFRVQLQNLYVQEGECAVLNDRKHCQSWQQLYPPVSTTTSITATVLESVPQARIIVLQRPVDGFVTITLAPDGQLLTEDGYPVAWEEVVAGVQVKASGRAGAAGTLLADQVQITCPVSPTPTTLVTPGPTPRYRINEAISVP